MQGVFLFAAPDPHVAVHASVAALAGTSMPDTMEEIHRQLLEGVDFLAAIRARSHPEAMPQPHDALGFYSDPVALGAAFRAQRVAAGVSTKQVGAWLGVRPEYVTCFERGTVGNTRTVIYQKLCLLYGLRYNFLPFTGDLDPEERGPERFVLSEPKRIIRNMHARLNTLGLADAEKEVFLGMPPVELERRIASPAGLDPVAWEILTYRLHMRVIPPATERLRSDNVEDLYARFAEITKLWEMTDVEFAAYLGTRGLHANNRGNLLRALQNCSSRSQITLHLARLCGWRLVHTPVTLPVHPGACYPDRSLVAALHTQLDALDWSYARLGIAVGTMASRVKTMLARLLEDAEAVDRGLTQRQFLTRACDLLHIVFYDSGCIPETRYLSTGDRLEDAARLGTLVAATRRRLRYTSSEWAAFLRVSRDTLMLLEGLAALDRPRRRRVLGGDAIVRSLEHVLEKSHIAFDPFHHLGPRPLGADVGAAEVAGCFRQDLGSCLVSVRRLALASGLDRREVRYALDGHYASRNPAVRRLGLPLRYRPSSPRGADERRSFAFATALSRQGLSDLDAKDYLGCRVEDVWALRRGQLPVREWQEQVTELVSRNLGQDFHGIIADHREERLFELAAQLRRESAARWESPLSSSAPEPDATPEEEDLPGPEITVLQPPETDLALTDSASMGSTSSLMTIVPGLRT